MSWLAVDAGLAGQVLDGLMSHTLCYSVNGGQVVIRLEKTSDQQAHVAFRNVGVVMDIKEVERTLDDSYDPPPVSGQRFSRPCRSPQPDQRNPDPPGRENLAGKPAGQRYDISFQPAAGTLSRGHSSERDMATQNQELILTVISETQVTFLLERMLKSLGYDCADLARTGRRH